AHIISTLAAAYAETGDFETARKYSKQAVEKGGEANEVAEQLAAELASYEAAKPWRERQSMEDNGNAGGEGEAEADKPRAKGDAEPDAAPPAEMREDEPAEADEKDAPRPEPLKPRRPFQD
ncbi:MAG: hypothetical protein ACKOCX_01900, partial [Planctomycetota bacterium]